MFTDKQTVANITSLATELIITVERCFCAIVCSNHDSLVNICHWYLCCVKHHVLSLYKSLVWSSRRLFICVLHVCSYHTWMLMNTSHCSKYHRVSNLVFCQLTDIGWLMFMCAAQKAPSVKCTLTVILALLCNCVCHVKFLYLLWMFRFFLRLLCFYWLIVKWFWVCVAKLQVLNIWMFSVWISDCRGLLVECFSCF